ncbi:RusA family crossover junction endodeoxyribonuclease [Corynebacterium diphtheriae]|uniref:RusA family crossover junction endodeoxyribonuclease n=1 Tax=Corynebacterium diphtheriae TaxID=1717 RepID=UPI00103EC57F|nr:RusA family crossover junction endodeoxyribonuclease [Corynebacterium diphtheriae bv. mitis]TBX14207.1 hypothetical protein BUW94_11855 [Corynebacterium diphtheriae]
MAHSRQKHRHTPLPHPTTRPHQPHTHIPPTPTQNPPQKDHPHDQKPDLDKLIRSTCDALTGTAYLDDNQINQITAQKIYTPKGTPPGCHIAINRTPEPTKDTP